MENQFNYFDNPIRRKVYQIMGIVLRLFGFVIVGTILSRLLLMVFTGINLTDSEGNIVEMEEGSEARFDLLLMQALNVILVYFALPFIYIYLFRKDLKRIFRIRKKKLRSFILLSFFIFLAALPFISQLIEFNKQVQLPERFSELHQEILIMEEHAKKMTQFLVLYDSWDEIFFILIVVAVLPGIGEELLFRGIIQNEMNSVFKNHHFAIWTSAILFSFIHFQFLGFLPRMILGSLFGYLYYWSGSLFVPMLIHFLNNAFTFALINYAQHQSEAMEITRVSTASTLIASIVCIFLIVVCYRLSLNVKNGDYLHENGLL